MKAYTFVSKYVATINGLSPEKRRAFEMRKDWAAFAVEALADAWPCHLR
jgi:hypothetical protein